MITYYDVLKVTSNASLKVISEAYNSLCKKYNPDNYQDEIKRAKAESVIKRLNEAFEILSDKKKRDDYDLKLKFIEDTDVILKDEKISSEIKQTDTNESVLKKINFGRIKEDISKSVENAKTLAEKIENSVHEKIENIDFNAIKSDIKDKIHTLDSNAEKKVKKDTEMDDDFYQKITTQTESINKRNNYDGTKRVFPTPIYFSEIVNKIVGILCLGAAIYLISLAYKNFLNINSAFENLSTGLNSITEVNRSNSTDYEKFLDNGGLDKINGWHGFFIERASFNHDKNGILRKLVLNFTSKTNLLDSGVPLLKVRKRTLRNLKNFN
jgi:curved DNA-binding protein CbpA